MQNIFAEPFFVGQDVVDDAAQKRDVCSRPDWYVIIREGTGAAESRIHVDDFSTILASFYRPPKADRMSLGHIGPHD